MSPTIRCPSCSSTDLQIFHQVRSIPTNSCIQLDSPQEARAYPKGDIDLGYCRECEFVSNLSFDSKLTEYSGRYEETQGYSATFNRFQRRLAEDLISRYGLRGKRVIEIGCGKGEFLELLCELGNNNGVGFDPGFDPDRTTTAAANGIEFVRDFYSEAYADYRGDFVCCKMTLEHISNTKAFMEMTRKSMREMEQTVVFFQVPSADRILTECAFEDIYYEHCSYFTQRSLPDLFARTGFQVLDVRTEYDDQYLTIEALASSGWSEDTGSLQNGSGLQAFVDDFPQRFEKKRQHWNKLINDSLSRGKQIALWGAGSKAVSFLHTVDRGSEIPLVVDINPHRQGHFMAGTAQEIVSLESLADYRPDLVIVMNRIYESEIRVDLLRAGLDPIVCSL